MKTAYKILIIVALLGVGGFALFYLFNKVEVPIPVEEGVGVLFPGFREIPEKSSQPETGTSTESVVVSKLSDTPVFDFWINRDTNEVYSITNEGTVFVAKTGDDANLNTQPLDVLNSIVPNGKGNKVIASFGDPQRPRWGVFDVVDGFWKPLPDNISSLSWGADDDTLVGVSDDGTSNKLVLFDISKNPVRTTILEEDFRIKDVLFSWTEGDLFLIFEKPSSLVKGRVWEFNSKNKTLRTIESGKNGLSLIFSPAGNYALQFSNPNNLLVTDKKLEPVLPLFMTTLPEKCGFGEERLFCFVPQDADAFLKKTLPDDYLQKRVYSVDDLVAVEPESGESITLMESGTEEFDPYDGKHIQAVKGSVYFLNQYDNFVYEARIPESFYTTRESAGPLERFDETNEPLPF